MFDQPIENNRLSFSINSEKKYIKYDIDNSVIFESLSAVEEYSRILGLAANKVKYGTEIIIPLSGGIDSERIALTCVQNQIPFVPVIIQYADEHNKFDIDSAFEFCKKNSLNPVILNLDLDEFFLSERHLFYAEKYKCRSPQLATHLWMIEQKAGFYIFPHNPLPLIYTSPDKFYISLPPLMYHCYETCLKMNDQNGIPLFNIYDSRIIYSFLKNPLYLNRLFNPQYSNLFNKDNYFFKVELYNQSKLYINPRKYKATGFENYRKFLNQKHGFTSLDYFDQTYRRPMENIVQDPCYPAIADIDLKSLYQVYCDYENTIE